MASAASLSQRLAVGFVAAALAMNDPLLSIWDQDLWLAGLPVLPLALVGVWAVVIALLAWTLERHAADEDPPQASDSPH
ncbi:MAG: hypothetical protein OHK0048_03370 [Rhodoferax sp.]